MGRAARYTLSVMVWVAASAGWQVVVGLVVAAVTGDRLEAGERADDAVPLGVSAVLQVLLPLVPTIAALWFNDWARDGFPSQAERRAGRRVSRRAGRRASTRRRGRTPEPTGPVEQDAGVELAAAYSLPVVPAVSLELEPLSGPPAHQTGEYPVAPLLRDER